MGGKRHVQATLCRSRVLNNKIDTTSLSQPHHQIWAWLRSSMVPLRRSVSGYNARKTSPLTHTCGCGTSTGGLFVIDRRGPCVVNSISCTSQTCSESAVRYSSLAHRPTVPVPSSRLLATLELVQGGIWIWCKVETACEPTIAVQWHQESFVYVCLFLEHGPTGRVKKMAIHSHRTQSPRGESHSHPDVIFSLARLFLNRSHHRFPHVMCSAGVGVCDLYLSYENPCMVLPSSRPLYVGRTYNRILESSWLAGWLVGWSVVCVSFSLAAQKPQMVETAVDAGSGHSLSLWLGRCCICPLKDFFSLPFQTKLTP